MYVNGAPTQVSGPEAFLPLSSFLRYSQSKTGTKVVCAEGDCGACSVLVAFPERNQKNKSSSAFRAMNSCIAPVYLLDGASIVTIEGIKSESGPSEVQKQITACFGSQCGFCTPGFVIALTAMYECQKKVDAAKVKNFTTGNLCRCTGYEPIVSAGLTVNPEKLEPLSQRYLTEKIKKDLSAACRHEFEIISGQKCVFGPTKTSQVSPFLKKLRSGQIVSSATDLGVQYNKEKIELDKTLTLHHVPKLFNISITKSSVEIGAKVTLADIQDNLSAELPEFCRFLNIFASPQIRNVATLAGNIANASPIGDTLPFLFVSEAILEIQGLKSSRKIPITEFYLSYKKTALRPGEWITKIIIPKLTSAARYYLYKVSQRRDLDISSVVAAFSLQKGSVKVAFGGVGPTTLRLKQTESFLSSKGLGPTERQRAKELLQKEISPISDLRASEAFRRKVSENLLEKFCVEAGNTL